jgi:hypothetical protein
MPYFLTPVDQMVSAIAESAAFRAWCGATDQTDARDNYIFDYATQIDTIPAGTRKWATVSPGPDFRLTRRSTGGSSAAFASTQGTVITFQHRLTAGSSYSRANFRTFAQALHDILTDILSLSGSAAADGRYIHGFEMITDPDVIADYGEIPTFRYPKGTAPGYLAIFIESTDT